MAGRSRPRARPRPYSPLRAWPRPISATAMSELRPRIEAREIHAGYGRAQVRRGASVDAAPGGPVRAPGGGRAFGPLLVRENLALGASLPRAYSRAKETFREVFALFP